MKIIKVLLVAGILLFSMQNAMAFDKDGFIKITKATIQTVMSGKVADVDKLIADQEKAIAIAVVGCNEYAQQAPEHAKLMKLVVDNADKMKAMTLEEIEPAWHEGEFLKKQGINIDDIDHFSAALSHMDSVLHPATAIIALREYKKSQDPDFLSQVKDELSEVLEHITHTK